MIIRSRAPCRISFAGGGTDVPYFLSSNDGALVNVTINIYAYAKVLPRIDGKIFIQSLDYDQELFIKDVKDLDYNGDLDLIKAVIRNFYVKGKGFNLITSSEAPPGSGLGLSSAIIVAIIGAIQKYFSKNLSKRNVAELAYQIEREKLGLGGGYQDQYSAAFGGFNFMEFKQRKVQITPIKLSSEIVNELKTSLVMYRIGMFRDSSKIHNKIAQKADRMDKNLFSSLFRQVSLAYQAKEALINGRVAELGEIIHQSWECKRSLHKDISNEYIDNLYRTAREAGAIGGKVSGAGGGGYLLLLCQPEKKLNVEEKLMEKGCQPVHFDFDFSGLSTWIVKEDSITA